MFCEAIIKSNLNQHFKTWRIHINTQIWASVEKLELLHHWACLTAWQQPAGAGRGQFWIRLSCGKSSLPQSHHWAEGHLSLTIFLSLWRFSNACLIYLLYSFIYCLVPMGSYLRVWKVRGSSQALKHLIYQVQHWVLYLGYLTELRNLGPTLDYITNCPFDHRQVIYHFWASFFPIWKREILIWWFLRSFPPLTFFQSKFSTPRGHVSLQDIAGHGTKHNTWNSVVQ